MPARGLGLGQAGVQGCVVVVVAALSKVHYNGDNDNDEDENVRRCKQGVSLFFQHCNSIQSHTAASSGSRTRARVKAKTSSSGATPTTHPLHPALVNAALQVPLDTMTPLTTTLNPTPNNSFNYQTNIIIIIIVSSN